MGKSERRTLSHLATWFAAATAPLSYAYLHISAGWSVPWAIVGALGVLAAFRGAIDLLVRKLTPPPELFGATTKRERAEDAVDRRRLYWWGKKFRLAAGYSIFAVMAHLVFGGSIVHYLELPQHVAGHVPWTTLLTLPLLFGANFLIFMGPMMMMGISQVKSYEPGDVTWGVELEHVRGQAEAKEEIYKVITLWESGKKFAKAGGKRERGVLFLGPPGTGKTMMAKAIATSFNSPIVTIPGSGFAQTFIGLDTVLVRYLVRKAKKLAAKWDGQCIVFIDEIDAVGMRRSALGPGGRSAPSGIGSELTGIRAQMPGGMMGGMGQMGLNSLLVAMDGIDSPPFFRRLLTSKINLWLDVLYVIPQCIGKIPLRLPKARPAKNEVYFIGATNVPLEALDPALVRPGRMGRHIYFRTPTKRDRADIFDFYLGKVSHEAELDTPQALEELARLTDGYSPAQIEQVCSIALTYAHHDSRESFSRADLVEAMVTVEAGTALGWGYESEKEEYSTAIHEAGHAACSHIWMKGSRSVRLSIKRRGSTGGHHQIAGIEERSFNDRQELFDQLVWGLGAYAAELVIMGETTQGVGGDLGSASYLAGTMVGRWGMAPLPVESAEERRAYAKIGKTLLAVAQPGDVQLPADKREQEAVILGQAFVKAYRTIKRNKAAIEKIATTLLKEKEIFGDDVVQLLDGVGLVEPELALSTADWPEL